MDQRASLEVLQARLRRLQRGQPRMRLSAVTFEDLRDLGLSVNEATRVLSYRYRGELMRVSDLEGLPGLSHRVRTTLEDALDD